MPVVENEITDGFTLTFGKNNYYFYDRATANNNCASIIIAADKYRTNRILHNANIPVPKCTVIATAGFNYDKLIATTSELKFPVVVKPTFWTGKGKDVVCNIPNLVSLFKQCERLVNLYDHISIEEYHGNLQEYRILVFKNKILDVLTRFPARIIGNGKDTIQKLVDDENVQRKKVADFLVPIVFDYEADLCLANQNLTKDSIPVNGKMVNLSYTHNTSRGGDIKSLSSAMCKENKQLFLKVAEILNLELAGIDVLCKSLNEPILHTQGVILEVNFAPSVRIHEEGASGVKNAVTMTVMRSFIYKHPIYYFMHLCEKVIFRSHLIIFITLLSIAMLFLYGVFRYF
jgi:cyanophycin synthetase